MADGAISSPTVVLQAPLDRSVLADFLESLPDAIIVVGTDGRILLANDQAERLFGYGRGGLLRQPVEVLLPERFRSAHGGLRSQYQSKPHARTMGAGLELFGLRRDGEEFPVEISLSPLETREGRVVMSAVRDISGRLHAERKFRGLLESAPDAMVIVDGEGRIVLINSQTEVLFGYSRDQLLGQHVEVLVPPAARTHHAGHRASYFGLPRTRRMGADLQLHGVRADGSEFPVEISLSPLETEDGLFVSSAIRDVTDRKRIEEALREKNLELENAARVKDRFLASMSHELRTPLNAIIGFTGTLLMKLPGPVNASQERQLQTIQSSARHLHSLINDLLDLAKIEAGNVELHAEPVRCREVLDEVQALLRPGAEAKSLAFDVVPPPDDVFVTADRRALTQILLNLAGNAVKFTDAGSVRVSCTRGQGSEAGSVHFAVADTGIGIAPEDLPSLFHSFRQLAASGGKRHEGAGLGLHLSQRLAGLMTARIDCESEPGRGSRFTLTFAGTGP